MANGDGNREIDIAEDRESQPDKETVMRRASGDSRAGGAGTKLGEDEHWRTRTRARVEGREEAATSRRLTTRPATSRPAISRPATSSLRLQGRLLQDLRL